LEKQFRKRVMNWKRRTGYICEPFVGCSGIIPIKYFLANRSTENPHCFLYPMPVVVQFLSNDLDFAVSFLVTNQFL